MARVLNINGNSDNGYRNFNRADVNEMAGVVRGELAEVQAGREENVLLIKAMANQWPAERILAVAQQRGNNWRFLAALTDKSLQAQGMGLLVAVAEATSMDLTLELTRKSLSTLHRLQLLYDEAVRQSGADPEKAKIYQEARQAVVAACLQGNSLFYQQVGRLILQTLGE